MTQQPLPEVEGMAEPQAKTCEWCREKPATRSFVVEKRRGFERRIKVCPACKRKLEKLEAAAEKPINLKFTIQ